MKERTQNVLVGAASIGGLAALAALLVLFGEFEQLLSRRYVITIQTDHASGLRRGSEVELNGVPIGVIDLVTVRDDADFPVRIVALIEPQVRIPEGSKPYATASLLGASSLLEIVIEPEGNGPAGGKEAARGDVAKAPATAGPLPMLPRNGTAVIREPMKIRMLEKIAAELDVRMRPVIEALGAFRELSTTYIAVGNSLDAMLQPGGGGAGDGPPTIPDAVAKLHEVLERASEAFELARAWLGDEQLRTDARTAVQKAVTLIDEASVTMQDVSRAAGAIETDGARLVARYVEVADELTRTLAQVRDLAHRAADGEGTVAQLLNRPDLHESLLDASIRLERVLREMELFIQKAKSEGLPVRW